MIKIGIFDPYLDTLGGGERYILTIAEYLSKKHFVDIFWKNQSLKKKLSKRFALNLKRVNFLPNISTQRQNLFKKLKTLGSYDIFFYVTDGSLFFSLAKKNILIIQSPVHFPKGTLNFLKLKNWPVIICYSEFIQKLIKKRLKKDSLVIPPPVEVEKIKPLSKKNIILSVGRFFAQPHNKKHEIMIEVFKTMVDKGLKEWELILIGGLEEDKKEKFSNLSLKAKGYPIQILANLTFEKLKEFYGRAKIYWQATGFGEDLKKYPERAEHFGIATLEAMSAGCVPVVINAGGQPEIVKENINGFLWKTEEELIRLTSRLIKDKSLWRRLSQAAQKRSKDFSKKVFCQRIDEIVKN